MQPSGGMGLRMYAVLMASFHHLHYEPQRDVIEVLEAAGRRLLRVSRGGREGCCLIGGGTDVFTPEEEGRVLGGDTDSSRILSRRLTSWIRRWSRPAET